MRKWLCLTAVLVVALGGSAMAAGYGSPPTTKLRTDAGSQRGGFGASDWTDRDGRICITGSGDGFLSFPRKALEAPGGHARVVLRTPLRPKRVKIQSWREIDE